MERTNLNQAVDEHEGFHGCLTSIPVVRIQIIELWIAHPELAATFAPIWRKSQLVSTSKKLKINYYIILLGSQNVRQRPQCGRSP